MRPQQTKQTKENGRSLLHSSAFLAVLLVVLTVLVYLPVRYCEFTNYDDQDYVTSNAQVKAGLSWAGIKWAFTSGFASNWHPLTWVSHMTDVQLFELNPVGHHFSNLFFHVGATVFLFLALSRLTGSRLPGAFVAGFFAVHPMHVESVAWIAERKDVLSGFWGMFSIWCYANYARPIEGQRPRGKIYYALTVLSFALGLLAKPMLVTLPFVFLLLDFWPLRRIETGWTKLVLEKVPFFLLSIGSSIVTFFVQRSSGAVRDLAVIPLDSRILNSFTSYWRYIGKLFWPTQLSVFYPMPDVVSGWIGLISGIGLIAVAAVFFWWRKKNPELLFGWLWFLGTLVPVIGIVQVGAQTMADRYSYIPSIGIFCMAVWAASKLKAHGAKIAVACAGCLLLAICGALTVKQIQYWKNTTTLFSHALEINDNNFVAHINLGSSLMQQNRFDEALKHYERALDLRDDMFEAHYGAAVILDRLGKTEAAMSHFQTAIQLRPGAVIARKNLADIWLRLGQKDKAVHELETAIATQPDYPEAHYNLGVALTTVDKERSIAEYQEAVRLKPDFSDALNNLAVSLADVGRFDAAAEKLREVVRLNPKDAEAHFNLSFVLTKAGHTNEAREHYETAFQLNPNLVRKK